MAFPSLAEIKSNVAVKTQPAESAPATESSAPTPVSSEAPATEGGDTNSEPQAAPVSDVQDAPADGAQDAAPATEGSEPGPIPYGRFKEKVEQAKTLKETNELLQQQLATLQASAQEKQREPEPEKPDPLLQKLESIEDYGGNAEALEAMKEMAAELKTLREKSSESSNSVQELRIQKQIQTIETDIASGLQGSSIHDQKGARVFVLESLARDSRQNINDLVGQFKSWEQEQEQVILDRLGIKRPEAKAAKEPEPDVPPRPTAEGAEAKLVQSDEQTTQKPKKPLTLKDLRNKMGVGRRR